MEEVHTLLTCCAWTRLRTRLRRTRGGRASKPPTRSRRPLRSPAFDDPAFSLAPYTRLPQIFRAPFREFSEFEPASALRFFQIQQIVVDKALRLYRLAIYSQSTEHVFLIPTTAGNVRRFGCAVAAKRDGAAVPAKTVRLCVAHDQGRAGCVQFF